jgi:hypothetical protein
MKKLWISVAVVFVNCVSANAQQQQPSEYTLKVSPADIDLISEGLGTQPFNKVVPLIQKLRTQVQQQQEPPKPPEAPKVEAPKE